MSSAVPWKRFESGTLYREKRIAFIVNILLDSHKLERYN
jgi:hypothetical protein